VASGCPRFMGNDHGVIVSADCGQTWSWVHEGLHALQIYSLGGHRSGRARADLYFATQDNDIWVFLRIVVQRGSRPILPEGLDLQAPAHRNHSLGVAIVYRNISARPCSPRSLWRGPILPGMQSWPLARPIKNFPQPKRQSTLRGAWKLRRSYVHRI